MKIDKSLSVYVEHPRAKDDFNKQELKSCRMLLRRLQFLEDKIRQLGGLENGGGSGGAAFVEWEADALEWALKELGFLPENNRQLEGAGR